MVQIVVFCALHFALDICNVPSLLFTGLSAMMRNLPIVKQQGGNPKAGIPLGVYSVGLLGAKTKIPDRRPLDFPRKRARFGAFGSWRGIL
jgi:hypothetical protein